MGKKRKSKNNVFVSAFSDADEKKRLERRYPAVVVLKVLNVILTSIFALFLGIIAPICIILGTDDPAYAEYYSTKIWLISSILYTIGLFALMLGKAKIASIIHSVAAVGTLITFFGYLEFFKDGSEGGCPMWYYLPCLGIAAITITITLLTNIPKWRKSRNDKKNEKAPSILGDK